MSAELPNGWTWKAVRKLVSPNGLFADGDWVESKDQDSSGLIRLIQLADIGDGHFLDKSRKFINDDAFRRLNCTEILPDDILIARMPAPLGRACLFPKLNHRAVTVVDVAILRPGDKSVYTQWLSHFLNAPQVRQTIELLSSGTTRRRITRKNLEQIQIPVPPTKEQKRIADKLEILLGRVDACRERLELVPALIRRFRQSVLTAATSGKLTENWRTQNRPNQEMPSDFGSQSFSSTSNQSLKEPEIPEGWSLVTMEQILSSKRRGMCTGPFGTALKKTDHKREGVPVLGIENIGQGAFAPGNRIFVSNEKAKELESFRVLAGDVIISRSGTVGELCVIPRNMSNALISTNLMRVSLNESIIDPQYFVYLFMAEGAVKNQVRDRCKGSTRAFLNQKILNSILFPLPTIAEQVQIIEIMNKCFASCDELEQTFENAKTYLLQLAPTILSKAFRGAFFPQQQNDRSAGDPIVHSKKDTNLKI